MKNSKSKNSSTGYKGVAFKKTGIKRFEAYIAVRTTSIFGTKSRKICIGLFDTLDEAVKARINFINKLY